MCSTKSKAGWLLSAILLFSCSVSLSADVSVYDGPVLPEGWYPIHETELDELDQNSKTINAQTLILQAMFARLLTKVNEWQTESSNRTRIVEASLIESEVAAAELLDRNRALRTELWLWRAGTVIGVGAFIVAVVIN